MSYEVSPMPTGPSNPLTSQTQPEMREPREFDPYKMGAQAYRNLNKRPSPPEEEQTDLKPKEETPLPPKAPEETVKLSPQLAALAKREQKFRQQQVQLEQERKALAAEKEELAQLKAMKEKLQAKDYSGLDNLVDYNEYSQYQVNKLNAVDPVQEEIKKLNGKISEIEKSTQDNINKQYEAAVNERRLATKDLIDKTDQFPLIKKTGQQEAVVQHILDTWEHDNEELSIEQAAKEVEEFIVDQAKRAAKLLEPKEEPKPVEAAPEVEEKKPLPQLKPQLKTLTNHVTTSEVKRPTRSLHGLSDNERWAEARRRAEEKLLLKTAR